MSAYYNVVQLPKNCKIRFVTPEATYEGHVKLVYPSGHITIDSTYLPDGDHFGVLRFHFKEILSFEILELPKTKQEPAKSLPPRGATSVLDAFDDSDDDIEEQLIYYDEDDDYASIRDYAFILPPHFAHLSSQFLFLNCFDTDFESVVSYLKTKLEIGVSLEGEKLGRNGSISWLSISSSQSTFFFDVCKLGAGLFDQGIRDIMEDVNIMKVIHDCRLVSDTFVHKYQTKLTNVFDTQVADKYVITQRIGPGPVHPHVNALNSCLRTWLGIPEEHLYRSISQSCKSYLYYLRPPTHEFLNAMIKNVIYLLSLKEKLDVLLLEQYQKAVEINSYSVLAMSPEELEVVDSDPEKLPRDLTLRGFKTIKSTHCLGKGHEKKMKKFFELLEYYSESDWDKSCSTTTVPSECIPKTRSNFSGSLNQFQKFKNSSNTSDSDSVQKCTLNESTTPSFLSKSYSNLLQKLSACEDNKMPANDNNVSANDNCEKPECSQLQSTDDPWERLKSELQDDANPIGADLKIKYRLVPSGQDYF